MEDTTGAPRAGETTRGGARLAVSSCTSGLKARAGHGSHLAHPWHTTCATPVSLPLPSPLAWPGPGCAPGVGVWCTTGVAAQGRMGTRGGTRAATEATLMI